MEKKLEKEAHNRNDKALKGNYKGDLLEHPKTNGTWSCVSKKSNHQPVQRVDRAWELRRAEQLFYVYGKWLFQNTKKLSHFAKLNANHAAHDDPEMKAAFEKCQRDNEHDRRKILEAIKKAPIVRCKIGIKGFPNYCLMIVEKLRWDSPADIIADEIWREMPLAFKRKPAKKMASLTPQNPLRFIGET